jgi:ubiquinol-cytochrome c reductase cytochrome b subunit
MTHIVQQPTSESTDSPDRGPDEEFYTWTGKARRWMLKTLPPDKLLPETQPSYVASWIYVFGMGAIASLVVLIVSGVVLSLNGPSWWHLSSFGHFINSTHLWSAEFFFLFMVVHLWGKFWMASWRGGRLLTWITGVVAFAASIGAAFTGYLVQTNFESEWISYQAKDVVNATGVGAWFNLANVGQMFMSCSRSRSPRSWPCTCCSSECTAWLPPSTLPIPTPNCVTRSSPSSMTRQTNE